MPRHSVGFGLLVSIGSSALLACPPLTAADQLTVPFTELTDQDLAHIDLHDGRIDDWDSAVGAPALCARDALAGRHMSWSRRYDPSDLDFRIWLAWHDATDRLYVAMERIDDLYINTYDRSTAGNDMLWQDGTVSFWVDGDRSGGELMPRDLAGQPLSSWPIASAAIRSSQAYTALAETHDAGPHIGNIFALRDWLLRPPYADGNGRTFSANPTVTVVEFYVTPFDDCILDDPAGSTVTDLSAGSVIGFAVLVPDMDADEPVLYGFTDAVSEYQLELLPRGIMVPKPRAGLGLDHFPESTWAAVKHAATADSLAPQP